MVMHRAPPGGEDAGFSQTTRPHGILGQIRSDAAGTVLMPRRVQDMVFHARFLLTALAILLGGATVHAQALNKARPKAVIELFTSQGCSSCPPADALLVELSKSPDLVALTMPVTYWDYLGWKDTLGKDSFAKRQKLYSKARGDGQIYTPQAVINGVAHVIGSDRVEIERAIKEHPASGSAARISLQEEGGNLRIRLTPTEAGDAKAGIWVLPTSHMVTVPITRGENQGKTISYVNVVRGIVRVGEWDGKEMLVTTPLTATQAPEADSYVVIVQAEQPGRYGMLPAAILGVARGGR